MPHHPPTARCARSPLGDPAREAGAPTGAGDAGTGARGGGTDAARAARRRTGRRDGAGFSLVEMLMVVAIFGILAAIAPPLFLKSGPAADVRDAADRLANVLRQARFRAISLKRPVFVEIEPGGEDDFYTVYADEDGDGSASGTPGEIGAARVELPDEAGGTKGVALPPGVRFRRGDAASSPDPDADPPADAVDVPVNPLAFQPRGTVAWPDGAADPSGGIYLSHEDHPEIVYAVVVMPTGSIKTWRLDDGGWR